MNRMVLLLVMLLSAGVILTGCVNHGDTIIKKPLPEIEPDGGVKDSTDPNASKTIESTLIVAFACEFSTLDLDRNDTELENAVYSLEAKLENGAVKGRYRAWNENGLDVDEYFRVGHTFMTNLHKVVAGHDLAQHNGRSIQVSGLPDQYGATLAVRYASKETINASDNQDNFLTIAAMEALEELFRTRNPSLNEEATEDAEKDAIPTPTLLDLTVSEEFDTENINGCYVSIRYPVVKLGYTLWDGSHRGAEGYEALYEALETYNTTIRMDMESKRNYTLLPEAQQADENTPMELYATAEAYITRSDDRVVSLWENVTWSTGQTGEMTFRRTCNFDAKTGELLGFTDVFTDPAALPALLGKALADKYPELPSVAEIEPVIAESLETNNGIVCFALANGGVHIFAEKNPLDGLEAGILQAILSYEDYPELVKPEYRTVSDAFVTKLAYDTDHILPDGTTLRMSWDIADEDTMDIRWSINVGGNLHSETFYGYAPECYVVYKEETAYLYLRVPAGDITNCTAIYEITSAGLSFIGEAELAMYEALNHHPDRMLMVTNDLVYSGYALLQPYGLYRVDETGMPVPAVSDVFGLRGPTLALTRDVEATFADLMDEQFEDGPLPLEAGTLLTPYRTDKASYIDFLDENGNVCRFAIERYADDMTLNNYGTLEELLEPVDAVG